MFVTGFVLDTVGVASVPASFGNIPGQWIKLGWPEKMRRTPEQFWRTLVADRGPNGLNVPVYYELAWNHACNPRSQKEGVWDSLIRRDINTEKRIHHGHCSIMAEFLLRVQSVIWNRKLIQTKNGRYLGLGPEKTEEGDGELSIILFSHIRGPLTPEAICILHGCSVPVILRQTATRGTGGKPVYALVG